MEKETLQKVMFSTATRRRNGKTSTLAFAIKNNPDAILVCMNTYQARLIASEHAIPQSQVKGLGYIESDKYRGGTNPIFYDHTVIEYLLSCAWCNIRDLEDQTWYSKIVDWVKGK